MSPQTNYCKEIFSVFLSIINRINAVKIIFTNNITATNIILINIESSRIDIIVTTWWQTSILKTKNEQESLFAVYNKLPNIPHLAVSERLSAYNSQKIIHFTFALI